MRILLFGFFLLVISCKNLPDKTSSTPHEKVLTSDSLTINYKITGTGDTTLLFLHGWGISQGYWQHQVDHFASRYKIATMDLPGFGGSGTNRDNYTIEKYAEDVAKFIRDLDLRNVVLIGHSMSGDIVLETAVNHPRDIIAIAGIDNFNHAGHAFTAQELAQVDSFFAFMERDYSNTVSSYADNTLFQPSTDSVVRNRVKNDISTSDKRSSISALRGLMNYAKKEKDQLSKLRLRLNLINSDAQPTDTLALKNIAGNSYKLYLIPATGHYPMIEKPEEFNSLLEQMLNELG